MTKVGSEHQHVATWSGVGPASGLIPLIAAVIVGLGLMFAIAFGNSQTGLTGSGSTTTYIDTTHAPGG